jgi:iron(III) transport system ATP-binding protein
VASFFGDVNKFSGLVENGSVQTALGPVSTNGTVSGTAVDVFVRPEALALTDNGGNGHGTVTSARFLGRSSLIDVRLDDAASTEVRIHVPGRRLPSVGENVAVTRDESQTFIFPK